MIVRRFFAHLMPAEPHKYTGKVASTYLSHTFPKNSVRLKINTQKVATNTINVKPALIVIQSTTHIYVKKKGQRDRMVGLGGTRSI